MLATKHLSRAVGGKLLVDDISIQVKAGEILAVVGPSGASKSSFLRLLARLHRSSLHGNAERQARWWGKRILAKQAEAMIKTFKTTLNRRCRGLPRGRRRLWCLQRRRSVRY
jgi:ABC-type multidrug transport system ATPase subunit